MKPRFFLSLSALFFSSVFAGGCLAQETSLVKLPGVAVAVNNTDMNDGIASASPNVVKVFDSYFKNASDLRWAKVDKNYFVSFRMNGQQNTALFKKNGYLINHVCYSNEQNLPADIRKMIKTHPDYLDYKITHVWNIKQDKRDVWAAYLESNNDFVLVSLESGMLEEVKRMNKQK
ncbi:hypothetical protein OCK74_06470 [Chitinophagaceae bacterium LB-8]|uniref:Beta-lactamase-inhibitor-like PepSY-like domain-containing protein n=1 Tax=Paraflavisolibacter caeni TaxID=2982496 RepID=A0A9X3BHE5_9BACT|nr:hypothetical protein [Paraflavisolibacter caeni]MCU7548753.1 hypothetical protein [Paraflavisolibacter caeni]